MCYLSNVTFYAVAVNTSQLPRIHFGDILLKLPFAALQSSYSDRNPIIHHRQSFCAKKRKHPEGPWLKIQAAESA